MMAINGAELADRAVDRADEIGNREWAQTCFEGSGEEVVEALVASNVRICGFAHVDGVFANEPADEPRCHRTPMRSGDATGQSGEALLGQDVLEQDRKAIGHQNLEASTPFL